MTSSVTTRVTLRPDGFARLARSPEVRQVLSTVSDRGADSLRQAAPSRTGAGRASIYSDVRMGPDGWYGVASWDDAHYYMGIQQTRTRWADPAIARIRYV